MPATARQRPPSRDSAGASAGSGVRAFTVAPGPWPGLGPRRCGLGILDDRRSRRGLCSHRTLWAPGNVVADAPVNSGTVAVSWNAVHLVNGAAGDRLLRHTVSATATAPCQPSLRHLRRLTQSRPVVRRPGRRRRPLPLHGHRSLRQLDGPSANSPSVTVINDNSLPTVTVASDLPDPERQWVEQLQPGRGEPLRLRRLRHRVDHLCRRRRYPGHGDGRHRRGDRGPATVSTRSPTRPRTTRATSARPSRSWSASTCLPRVPLRPGAGHSQRLRVIYHRLDHQGHGPDVDRYRRSPGQPWASSTGRRWSEPLIATGGTYTITASTLANGVHTVTAQATDLPRTPVRPPWTDGRHRHHRPICSARRRCSSAASDSGISDSDRVTNVHDPGVHRYALRPALGHPVQRNHCSSAPRPTTAALRTALRRSP